MLISVNTNAKIFLLLQRRALEATLSRARGRPRQRPERLSWARASALCLTNPSPPVVPTSTLSSASSVASQATPFLTAALRCRQPLAREQMLSRVADRGKAPKYSCIVELSPKSPLVTQVPQLVAIRQLHTSMLQDLVAFFGKTSLLQLVIRALGKNNTSLNVALLIRSLTLIVAMNMCGSVLPRTTCKEHLQHYFECKAIALHTTSACILLKWKHAGNPWRKYLPRLVLLRDFPCSSLPCLTGQETLRVRTWQVYHDAHVPQPSTSVLSNDAAPRFRFAALLAGVPTTALVEPGSPA